MTNKSDNNKHGKDKGSSKKSAVSDKIGSGVVILANVFYHIYWAFLCGLAGIVFGFFTELSIAVSGSIGIVMGLVYIYAGKLIARKYGNVSGAIVNIGLLILLSGIAFILYYLFT